MLPVFDDEWPPSLKMMQAFNAVVECNTLTAAAKMLHISVDTLSLQIRKMERALGATLVRRSARNVALTAEGERLYARTKKIVDNIWTLETELKGRRQRAAGEVRIDASASVVKRYILPHLSKFYAENPDVTLKISQSGHIISVVDTGYDVMFRRGPLQDTELVARAIGFSSRWTVAAPSYLAQRGTVPQCPDDLLAHNCIRNVDEVTGRVAPLLFDDGSGPRQLFVSGNLICNEGDTATQAALRGFGILSADENQVAVYVAEGRLVRLLPEWSVPVPQLNILFHRPQHMPSRVRRFVDFMISALTESSSPTSKTG